MNVLPGIVLASVILLSNVALGQSPTAEPIAAPNGAPTVYEPWQTSFERATQLALKTDRPIMLVISGSDWNSDSNKLKQEILLTHEFSRWSTRNVVKIEIDFPRFHQLAEATRKQNQRIHKTYVQQIQQYPTVLFISPQGKVLGTLGYEAIGPHRWTSKAEMLIPPKRRAEDLVT